MPADFHIRLSADEKHLAVCQRDLHSIVIRHEIACATAHAPATTGSTSL